MSASTFATAEQYDPPTGLSWLLKDSWTEATRHLKAVPRNPELLIFATIQPIMFIVLFVYVFKGSVNVPIDYVQYVIPGIFAQTILFNSAFTGVGVADDLSKGIIDRLRSLPMYPSAVLIGRTLTDVVRNVITFAVMLAVAFAVGFRFEGSLAGAVGATALMFLWSYAFSWIAALIGLSVGSVEAANSAGFIWMFPLMGVTTIYVTHDQIEAMTMGDRVAVMRKGLLQQVDDPQVLYDNPDNLFVAGFIGSPPMNMVQATLVDGDGDLAVTLGDQRLAVDPALVAAKPAIRDYVGRPVAMGVRSEDLTQPGPRNDVPENQRLRSTARLTEALGSEIVVHFPVSAPPVETEDTKELRDDAGTNDAIGTAEESGAGTKFMASFSPRSTVKSGDDIEVGVDTSRLYFFDLDTGLAIRD